MTTITFTDLQLRVTLAPWRKAQMPQWDDAEWRIHLHHECVLYLNGNGKAKVFGATIEDLADRGMTDWDKAGVGFIEPTRPVNQHIAEANKELAKRADKMAELPASLAAPADPEWPKWWLQEGQFEQLHRMDHCGPVNSTCESFMKGGATKAVCDRCVHESLFHQFARVIMEAEALKWLRANGHAKVAEELERQAAPAPATVPAAAGLQVWQLANILTVYGADGRSVAAWCGGKWVADKGFTKYPGETRLPAAEEAREIEAAREAGVL